MINTRSDMSRRLILLIMLCASTASAEPLKVFSSNPRYFTDGSGEAVYLTGSHTWANLVDIGTTDPPPSFDYDAYLAFLKSNNHNFIRMWGRHLAWYPNPERYAQPMAWSRNGPGNGLDSKPKFDLTQLNQAYFDRLRSRVVAARDQGIYVSIMLFGGKLECEYWSGNPFNAQNNINGIDGDPNMDGTGCETQTLQIPAVTQIQESYVKKIIDTVNDLDNVLFEISNESSAPSTQWQYHLINYIHDYERTKPKQHPVGMTMLLNDSTDLSLFDSPADWISPGAENDYISNPAAADGAKVIILDTDHLGFELFRNNPPLASAWAWKSFCRGYNPILMEYIFIQGAKRTSRLLTDSDPGFIAARQSMGHTLTYAKKINLAAMPPQPSYSSTGYTLVQPGIEYLVYQPNSGSFNVVLEAATYNYEWFDPASGTVVTSGSIDSAGGSMSFTPSFSGPAVLYLKNTLAPAPPAPTPVLPTPSSGWTFCAYEDQQLSLGGGASIGTCTIEMGASARRSIR